MHDTVRVRVPERRENFTHQPRDVGQRKALIRLKELAQLAAFDKLHRNVCDWLGAGSAGAAHHGRVVIFRHGFTVVVDRDNTRMIEPARSLRFAFKPLHDFCSF